MTGSSLTIAVCYGTRPQVIKASILRREFAGLGKVVAVDTGQHYDFSLNALLYQQLGVQPPDSFLEVGSGGHASQTAAVLIRSEELLKKVVPSLVVVIGDTNSTLGAALAAAKLRIPVLHVEAGLRATDVHMAEEINRRVVDAVSDVLCAPSERAMARLKRERVDGDIVNTGDVARDVLRAHVERVPPSGEVTGLGQGVPYAYCTLHRAELTDRPDALREVLRALGRLPIPVVFPVHPRTRAVLGGLPGEGFGPSLRAIPPVGYLESLSLAKDASIVVTDSGGVQREAYWLGVPCVTVRPETEWGETVEVGANELVAPERAAALTDVVTAGLRKGSGLNWNRDIYGDGAAAKKIVEAARAAVSGS